MDKKNIIIVVNLDLPQSTVDAIVEKFNNMAGSENCFFYSYKNGSSDLKDLENCDVNVAFACKRCEDDLSIRKIERNIEQYSREINNHLNPSDIKSTIILDCAERSDIPISKIATLARYLKKIADNLTGEANSDVLSVDYKIDNQNLYKPTITKIDLVSIKNEDFIDKCVKFYERNIEKVNKNNLYTKYMDLSHLDKFVDEISCSLSSDFN